MNMYLLGYDIGSSSVKASLLNGKTGLEVATAQHPKVEMNIDAPQPGWAEQNPSSWWDSIINVTTEILTTSGVPKDSIAAIGISYQMHGLVLVDQNLNVLRPSIIWCDSRAVPYGNQAFDAIGHEQCLSTLLNSPGNFTASKLAWVKEKEPDIYERIHKFMLPGDYIAMKLSGECQTTYSGLSEGIFYNFQTEDLSSEIMNHFGFAKSLVPDIVPTFSIQAKVSKSAGEVLGLAPGTPITYRAGDQPNNALSLNVLNPGEIAATAGTSGVVYGVTDETKYDPHSRVNTFAHVNHKSAQKRLGILLCINGTGILYSWANKNLKVASYEEMNDLSSSIPVGSESLVVVPFGNGAERILQNKDIGAHIGFMNFNVHSKAHLLRAMQEGIAFSFKYGLTIMETLGLNPSVIRAGNANLFLSKLFRQAIANLSGAAIELYNTDGAQGAARGAGIGLGYFDASGAFAQLQVIDVTEPDPAEKSAYEEGYERWSNYLSHLLSQGA
jgi:xylulokinase